MGKLKDKLIELETMMMEKLDKQYRPFQPATRLDDVQVLGAAVKPHESLLDGREWVPSTQTDVTRTWRRFGWRPIAEIEAEKAAKGEIRERGAPALERLNKAAEDNGESL